MWYIIKLVVLPIEPDAPDQQSLSEVHALPEHFQLFVDLDGEFATGCYDDAEYSVRVLGESLEEGEGEGSCLTTSCFGVG